MSPATPPKQHPVPGWDGADTLNRLAHDLRTPLNVMQGYAQLLGADVPAGSELAEAAAEIMRAGRQMARLVDEVQDLAHLEGDKLHLQTADMALAPILDAAVAEAAQLCDASALHTSSDSARPFYVHVDRLGLHSSLVKLLTTAARFNRSSGPVRVHAKAVDDQRVAVVAQPATLDGLDLAAGLEDASAAPYTSSAGQEATERACAELAVASRVLALMNGHLFVSRAGGGGFRFRLELPRSAVSGASGIAPPSPTAGLARGVPKAGHKVLYIEDNPANQRLVRTVLRQLTDVDLHLAANAHEGMLKVRQLKPQLVLLDVCLPDRCGLDLLPEMRAIEGMAQVPVLGLSANAMPSDVARAMAAGITAYIAKPVDMHVLLQQVRYWLPMENEAPR